MNGLWLCHHLDEFLAMDFQLSPVLGEVNLGLQDILLDGIVSEESILRILEMKEKSHSGFGVDN